jgi:limonene-1,2-epoxide hydrolase
MSRRLEPACAYAAAWERLSPDTLPALGALFADDVRFRDPFNDVRGRDAALAVFRDMFERVEEPRFTVFDIAASDEAAYLKWRMTFRLLGKPASIEGMSEIRFAADGRVSSHVDHWDAAGQLYEKLPGLSVPMRWLRRRLSAKT